jgi:hypothetical protein
MDLGREDLDRTASDQEDLDPIASDRDDLDGIADREGLDRAAPDRDDRGDDFSYGFEVGYYAAYAADWKPGELYLTFESHRIVTRAYEELSRWTGNHGLFRIDDLPIDDRRLSRFIRGFVAGFQGAVTSRVVHASLRSPPWVPRQPL